MLIKLSSRGPVLYKQERVGVHGDRFRIWKFRTMRVGADQESSDLAHLNHSDGLLFKIRKIRGSPGGALDTAPLPGRAAPVVERAARPDVARGPAAASPCEVEQYGDDVRRRLLVKPGMTGLWQISGRAELPWDESVGLTCSMSRTGR